MVSLQSSLCILFKRDKVVLTHLGKGFSKYTLMDYEVIDLSSVEDRSEDHIDVLIQNGISHFLEEHRIKPDSVSIGIPREDVFFTFAELPKVPGASLEDLLNYEIERHVPLPSESICFDAQVVERGEAQDGMLKVAIIAAHRDLIQRYANIVEQIDLTASSITISALGLVDFFVRFGEPADHVTTALVDCDNGNADVVILRGKELMHCRSIDLERDEFGPTRQRPPVKKTLLGEKLKELGLITDEQLQMALTEQRKTREVLLGQILFNLKFISEQDLVKALSGQTSRPPGTCDSENVKTAAVPADVGAAHEPPYSPPMVVLDQAYRKKAQAILDELTSYLERNGEDIYIDELYLSGEYRSALALQGTLLELGFAGRIKMLQPHRKIRSLLPPEKASSLCPAIGLGMRDFEERMTGTNLLPRDLRARPRLYGKRFMIVLSIALCILLVAVLASSIAKRRMEVGFLEAKVQSLVNEVELVSATRHQSTAWGGLLKDLKAISEGTLNPLLVLKELDRLLPSDGPGKVWLTDFRLKGISLSINGRSNKPEEILTKLEESPIFKNVRFEGQITSGTDSERFGVVAEIDVGNQWGLLRTEREPIVYEKPIGPEPPPEGTVVGARGSDEEEPEEEPEEMPELPLRNPFAGMGFDRTQQPPGPDLPLRNPFMQGPPGQMFDNRLPATGMGAVPHEDESDREQAHVEDNGKSVESDEDVPIDSGDNAKSEGASEATEE